MKSQSNDGRFEIALDCVIALIAFSAAAYSLSYTHSYGSAVAAIAASAIAAVFNKHNLSENIGEDFRNAHFIIIPVIILCVIWIGALNTYVHHYDWPAISGIMVAAIYMRDAIKIYKLSYSN